MVIMDHQTVKDNAIASQIQMYVTKRRVNVARSTVPEDGRIIHNVKRVRINCNNKIQQIQGFYLTGIVLYCHIIICLIMFWLFTVCSNGTFGLACSMTCHCPPNDLCNPVNGLCLGQKCARGWTGTSCQIRKHRQFFSISLNNYSIFELPLAYSIT